MDELAKLQLVSKVCGRLDEELGVGDRTLAEFVIHLAETQGTPSAFGAALAENGADFPEPFVAALFALAYITLTSTPTLRASAWATRLGVSLAFAATQLPPSVLVAAMLRPSLAPLRVAGGAVGGGVDPWGVAL